MKCGGRELGLARGVFVTGTDTGVGKTLVASAILRAWRKAGVDAVPMKPVQTGCTGPADRLRAPDLDVCLKAASLKVPSSLYAQMAPYRYRPACSPHLAALLAGRPILISRILAAGRALLRKYDRLVVEGAGGLLVPVGRQYTMLDIMVSFGLPVVVVARPGLGTLNHTLMTLEMLRFRRLTVLGIVINQSKPGRIGRIETDNIRTLKERGGVPILAFLPYKRSRAGMNGLEVPLDRPCPGSRQSMRHSFRRVTS